MQKWFIENLPIARKTLDRFKSLSKLFDGFKQWETKRYKDTRNHVLSLCLPRRAIIPLDAHERLAEIDKAIELFDAFNWATVKLRDFKSRITSGDYIQSFSVCTELLVAKRLVDILGKNKVEIFPKIETGFSDILVKLKDKVVYLEVGILGESLPEKKIQRILNETAKHLGSNLKAQCYFSATVDTTELVFDQRGYIDEKASIEKIISEIDRLCLDKLKGFTGLIFLDKVAYVIKNKELLEKIYPPIPSYDPIKKDLELIRSPVIKNWIDLCRDQIVEGSKLFKGGFICKKLNYLLIEIRSLGMFPSKSATAELNSVLNHFVRHIEEQLNQLQPKNPNIIIVHGYNWMLFGLGFEPLYKRIQQFFKDKKEAYLSGVVVLGRKNEKVYINNEYATASSQLGKDDIEKLGFKWF